MLSRTVRIIFSWALINVKAWSVDPSSNATLRLDVTSSVVSAVTPDKMATTFLPLFAPPGFELTPGHSSANDRASPMPVAPTSLSGSLLDSSVSRAAPPSTTFPQTTTTVTVTAAITMTETVTVIPSSRATSAPAVWSAPKNITDLSTFGISEFAGGEQNLEIVTGIPAKASATILTAAAQPVASGAPSWDNSSAVMQLFYPATSINPRNSPQGGAEFYAEPLVITDAHNVTLEYSVFFPADFDWVLAGKLPGLYGGHTGCSGGDDALSCFSTRLMWRQGGQGELYLYAPKDKQTEALCADPQSVCSSVYGLSVGRGSFYWKAGAWTNVRQMVSLNTPGKPDGSFLLQVDGKEAISRADIFYRDEAPADSTDETLDILIHFDGDEHRAADWQSGLDGAASPAATAVDGTADNYGSYRSSALVPDDEGPDEPVGFVGIFFSTFFGGHESRYATPRDQYVWFKDFSVSKNG